MVRRSGRPPQMETCATDCRPRRPSSEIRRARRRAAPRDRRAAVRRRRLMRQRPAPSSYPHGSSRAPSSDAVAHERHAGRGLVQRDVRLDPARHRKRLPRSRQPQERVGRRDDGLECGRRASRSGRNAADTSSALARASTTGCRFAPLMAVDAVAISAIAPRVSTPAARADAERFGPHLFVGAVRHDHLPVIASNAPHDDGDAAGGRATRGGRRSRDPTAAGPRTTGRASPAAGRARPERPSSSTIRHATGDSSMPTRVRHVPPSAGSNRRLRQSRERPTHAAAHTCTPLTCAGRVVSVNMLLHHACGTIRSSPTNAPAAFRTTCGSRSPSCCSSGWRCITTRYRRDLPLQRRRKPRRRLLSPRRTSAGAASGVCRPRRPDRPARKLRRRPAPRRGRARACRSSDSSRSRT